MRSVATKKTCELSALLTTEYLYTGGHAFIAIVINQNDAHFLFRDYNAPFQRFSQT